MCVREAGRGLSTTVTILELKRPPTHSSKLVAQPRIASAVHETQPVDAGGTEQAGDERGVDRFAAAARHRRRLLRLGVNDHAGAGTALCALGLVELSAAVTQQRAEGVSEQARDVNVDERHVARTRIAVDERDGRRFAFGRP